LVHAARLAHVGRRAHDILGTKGYIELRKYIDIASEPQADNQLLLVNDSGEKRFSLTGKVGYPFFGQLMLDCLHRTEQAMTQMHAFKAAELCLIAQERAVRLAGEAADASSIGSQNSAMPG
jgi:hypothetical protein